MSRIDPIAPDLGELKVFRQNQLFLVGSVGSLIYDLSIPQGNSKHRISMAALTTELSILGSTADDFLDLVAAGNRERHEFLEQLTFALFNGHWDEGVSNPAERVPLWIAANVYQFVFRHDYQQRTLRTWQDLVASVKKQFVEKEPDTILMLEQVVARRTLELFAHLVEIITGTELDRIRHAVGCLGAYGQALDNFKDLDVDIADNVNTYGTARLLKEGDNHIVRESIRARYLRQAESCYSEAMGVLETTTEKTMFRMLKEMMDARCHSYKLVAQPK